MVTYTKVIDDQCEVHDPHDAPRETEHEFCMISHVHFMARDADHAMELLAKHFAEIASGSANGKPMFHAGTMTVGRATRIHIPEAPGGVH